MMKIKSAFLLLLIAAIGSFLAYHYLDGSLPKNKIYETPLMVESVRSIGQLITAQYSGEVISTLSDEVERVTDSISKLSGHASQKFSKAKNRKQIIAIGRGRVQAGINLSLITEKNFRYVNETKHVYISGIKIEIFHCDINPWFIPEKKIPGFEIIAATNAAANNGDLLLVKQGALRRLGESAVKAGIIARARTNAENSLREYLSILTGLRIEKAIIL